MDENKETGRKRAVGMDRGVMLLSPVILRTSNNFQVRLHIQPARTTVTGLKGAHSFKLRLWQHHNRVGEKTLYKR